MSLTDAVEKRLKELPEQGTNKAEAIRNAEKLADQFSYVKPKTEIPTSEKFFGLPAFQNGKNAGY